MVSNLNNIGLQSAFAFPTLLPQGPASVTSLAATSPQALGTAVNPLGGYRTALSSITNSIGLMLASGLRGNRPASTPSSSTGRPKIVQIDDFSTGSNGFNHGQEIAKTLNPDGSVDLVQYDISKGGNKLANINNALDDVIARVENGEQIDAINLSQQDLDNSPISQAIRAKIDKLSSLGVPVAVAAGNGGPGAQNALATNTSFNVSSATNGVRNGSSGIGNVQAEGRTTSFATANFARELALKHAQGYSSGQLLNLMA